MKLWDEVSEEWKAVPTLKGDTGPKGDQGIPGDGLIEGTKTSRINGESRNTSSIRVQGIGFSVLSIKRTVKSVPLHSRRWRTYLFNAI